MHHTDVSGGTVFEALLCSWFLLILMTSLALILACTLILGTWQWHWLSLRALSLSILCSFIYSESLLLSELCFFEKPFLSKLTPSFLRLLVAQGYSSLHNFWNVSRISKTDLLVYNTTTTVIGIPEMKMVVVPCFELLTVFWFESIPLSEASIFQERKLLLLLCTNIESIHNCHCLFLGVIFSLLMKKQDL